MNALRVGVKLLFLSLFLFGKFREYLKLGIVGGLRVNFNLVVVNESSTSLKIFLQDFVLGY